MSDWALDDVSGAGRALVCRPLREAGLPHLFTLRPGGDPAIPPAFDPPEPHAGRAGLPPRIVRPHQVHGAGVGRPAAVGSATDPREADAVVVGEPGVSAAVATADCLAAILFAPRSRAFALVHAGWRGTLAGALPAAIAALEHESGEEAASFLLAMGPAIGRCCFEVGPEVREAFDRAFDGAGGTLCGRSASGGITLDLLEANRRLALGRGVRDSSILAAGICTVCRRDLCWSHRAEGGRAGRMWAIAGIPG